MSKLAIELQKIANERGCRDPLSINIWSEGAQGELISQPGLFVPISYRRADGGKRLRAQLGGNVRKREFDD